MILKDESGTIRFGIFAIFLLVGIFGIWMGLAPLASSAVAVGKVSVVDNKKTIQHLEGGVVSKIYVKDGDMVKMGDPLLEIKNARLNSEIQIARNELLQNSVLFSRLLAQKDNSNEIKFDLNLKDFSGYNEAINTQKDLLKEQNKLLKDELDILKQRISQLQKQINGTKAILEAKKDRMKSLNEEKKEWQRLYKEQLIDKTRLRDIDRENSSLQGDIASLEADIARLNVQITETKSQMLVRERSFKEDVLKRIEDTRTKLTDSSEKYAALLDQSERTIIRAPVDGSVVELAIHTIGGVIRPGDKIMSIVPAHDDYVIDARLNVTDIDMVHVGQNAAIHFSAFNTNQSKVIEGKVTYISADSLTDERGHSYYELKADLTQSGKKELEENKFFLLPGMPAEVMVQTGERTMLNYLLKPFLDMFKRAFNED